MISSVSFRALNSWISSGPTGDQQQGQLLLSLNQSFAQWECKVW